MFRKKRGQAALEFLMSYGWALLLALVVIGALVFYFGWDTSSFVSDFCMLGPGLYCKDITGDEGSVSLIVKNSMGKDLEGVEIFAEECDISSGGKNMEDGQELLFTLGNCDLEGRNIFDSNLIVNYEFSESSITHGRDGNARLALSEGDSQSGSGGYDPGSGGGNGYNPDGATVFLLDFSEGDGYDVNDLSSNEFVGTHYGNTRFLARCDSGDQYENTYGISHENVGSGILSTKGVSNEGWYFPGDSALRIKPPEEVFNVDEGSWEMWANATFSSLGDSFSCLFELDNNPGLSDDVVTYKNETNLMWGDFDQTFLSYMDIPPDNIWTHVVFTWEYDELNLITTIKAYKDGAEKVSGRKIISGKLDPPHSVNEEVHFGILQSWGRFYTGAMDEIAIYSKALEANEIASHFSNKKAVFTDWYEGTLEFDGVDDWLEFSGVGDLNITQNLTVEAWINPGSDQANPYPHIVFKEDSFKLFIYDTGKVEFRIWESGGGFHDVRVDNNNITFDQWNHVAGTFNGTDVSIYVRDFSGKLIGSSTTNLGLGYVEEIKSNTNPLFIGNWDPPAPPARPFNGRMDDVRISDYARY